MMAKGRKSVLRNAKLLSVYLDEEFTEKLEQLSSQTLVPKAAIARDILTRKLIEIGAN
jgi:predicted DNA-binding protein